MCSNRAALVMRPLGGFTIGATDLLTSGYTLCYTPGMKTAISIPDQVFEAADDLARQLGMSRSQLYTTAVTRFLESHNDEAITQALNEVYSDSVEPVDPLLLQMQLQSLPDEEWS